MTKTECGPSIHVKDITGRSKAHLGRYGTDGQSMITIRYPFLFSSVCLCDCTYTVLYYPPFDVPLTKEEHVEEHLSLWSSRDGGIF